MYLEPRSGTEGMNKYGIKMCQSKVCHCLLSMAMGIQSNCNSMLTMLGWACEEPFGSHHSWASQTLFWLVKEIYMI